MSGLQPPSPRGGSWLPEGPFRVSPLSTEGHEGALELWNTLRGPWDDQDPHIDVERIEDLGVQVLALLTMRASGESSGVPVAIRWAHVITSNGDDQRIRSYASWGDALQAVGLE